MQDRTEGREREGWKGCSAWLEQTIDREELKTVEEIEWMKNEIGTILYI